MSNQLVLYYNDSLKRFSLLDVQNELKRWGSFGVFLSFVDPRTDCLVQDTFTFYPKAQVTTRGRCFIAEHEGLPLRIPADMHWWVRAQTEGNMVSKDIAQETAILVRGEYVSTKFTLSVSPRMRIDDTESPSYRNLKAS